MMALSLQISDAMIGQWASLIQSVICDINAGNVPEYVETGLQAVEEAGYDRENALLLLAGLVASQKWRTSPEREANLNLTRILTMSTSGDAAHAFARTNQEMFNWHGLRRFQTLLIAGYTAAIGARGIRKRDWDPLLPTLTTLLAWDTGDQATNAPYKTLHRRFKNLSNDLGDDDAALAAGMKMFSDLRNFLDL